MDDPTIPVCGIRQVTPAGWRVRRWLTCAILFTMGHSFAGEVTVVSTAIVESGRLSRQIRQQVTITPYERVDVYAKATGYIERIVVDIGDVVAAGQELARLDVPELDAEILGAEAVVSTANANVKKAIARLALRELVYTITEKLVPRKAKTPIDLEEAGAERDIAKAELNVAKAQEREAAARLEQARVLAGYLTVSAPFDGVVTQRFIDTGALVRSGSESGARPLVEVQRTNRLRCHVEIPESDVIFVLQSFQKRTLSASFVLDALPGREFKFDAAALAKVARFSQMVHPESRHMHAMIDLENSDGLLVSGLSARLVFQARGLGDEAGVLIPNVAVQSPRRGTPHVFVVKATVETNRGPTRARLATVQKRDVELGTTDGSRVEVLKGLGAGEEVVARGAGSLISGQQVRVSSGASSASNARGRR